MSATEESGRCVRQFRQILLWPLQLMSLRQGVQIQNHWELLKDYGGDNPWSELSDGFDNDSGVLQERQYSEFVTFLPHVQRLLYGDGKGRGMTGLESPIRIFRRSDVTAVRVHFPESEAKTHVFDVARVDLYFFYDLDVALLVVEIGANDISFETAEETLYRMGRSYPTFWTPEGNGGHCFEKVEWLDAQGHVLACSDYERRDKFLAYASHYHSPSISAHWEFLLRPLVLHHSDEPGPIRYRLVEYHRMPQCAFLSLDDPGALSRADFVRLAFAAPPGPSEQLPFSVTELHDFERRYCIDRHWSNSKAGRGTRLLCSGECFVMITGAQSDSYTSGGPSLLEQFRRQYFLIFMLPHLHKATLNMLADRLIHTLNQMDLDNAASVRRFKREIRLLKEIFLRFSHRYWFHEVTDQAIAKTLYKRCGEHLGLQPLYAEISAEIEEMSRYLDSDSIRRQANTVLRLTVVTTFGLIGTLTTGFLGMNLIDETDATVATKLGYFALIFIPTTFVTLYTIVRSKRLSDFLDALSDERLGKKQKLRSLLAVWRRH